MVLPLAEPLPDGEDPDGELADDVPGRDGRLLVEADGDAVLGLGD